MPSNSHTVRHSPARLALLASPAIAALLVSGCTGAKSVRSASASQAERDFAKSDAKADKAVFRAEQAVARAPRDAGLRAALGQAYLVAGRFTSAATTLDEAMTLGDRRGQTALALGLALIGEGRHAEALALLEDWRGEIAAADLGLALALAGDAARGVAVLTDAVRGGEGSPKLRQNLAYAYALDGRWSEARLMAAQDVPAGELDRRLALWALSTLPDRNQDRVAGLIGAPVRLDPGQPAALALAPATAAAPALAAAAPAAPVAAAPAAAAELAPAAAPQPAALQANVEAQAASQPQGVKVHRSVAQTFGIIAPTAAPAIQARTVQAVAARRPVVAARPASAPRAARVAARPASGPPHLVQLGAYSSQQSAQRAWAIFTRQHPALTGYRMTITPGSLNGKPIWRVAAGGLAGRPAAIGLCSSLKAQGNTCFAYAAPSAPVVPFQGSAGPQRARR